MIKILIIGLGSIGIRHANALLTIGNVQLGALRTGKGTKDIETKLKKAITFFFSEEDALKWNPTHIIISNPTSMHITYLNKFIKTNSKIFIEKPISDKLSDIKKIKINRKNIYVGYNLRFHKLIQTVKQAITENTFGKPIAAELSVGHYLPAWHPYEDYRKGYAAKKKLGGGVLRTLSHEIDLLQYFFGDIKSVFAKVSKISMLEIDVDDYTTILAETKICKRTVINLNYLNPKSSRNGKIFFEKGVLVYDFNTNTVHYTSYNSEMDKVIFKNTSDFNQQYIEQMKDFINFKSKQICTFKQAINVMKVINICELSNKEKKELCLD